MTTKTWNRVFFWCAWLVTVIFAVGSTCSAVSVFSEAGIANRPELFKWAGWLFLVVVGGMILFWGVYFWFMEALPSQRKARRKEAMENLSRLIELCEKNEALTGECLMRDRHLRAAISPSDEELSPELIKELIPTKEVVDNVPPKFSEVLNKDNPRFRAELACAVTVWLSFEVDPTIGDGLTPKKEAAVRIADWLQANPEFKIDAERVATLVNWDKNGNKFQKS